MFGFVCVPALEPEFLLYSGSILFVGLPIVAISSLAAYYRYQKTSKSAWMEACKTVDLIAGGICALFCLIFLIFLLIESGFYLVDTYIFPRPKMP
jgi:hypothetical protein